MRRSGIVAVFPAACVLLVTTSISFAEHEDPAKSFIVGMQKQTALKRAVARFNEATTDATETPEVAEDTTPRRRSRSTEAAPQRNAYVDEDTTKSRAQVRIENAFDAVSDLEKLVVKHAKEHGVPVGLAQAIVSLESGYNARATGSHGEIGLMQIKASTARGIGYTGSSAALYDPETNLAWGMKYLAAAYELGGGDVCGTILRYNAGHHATRMNKLSAGYCAKVKGLLGKDAA